MKSEEEKLGDPGDQIFYHYTSQRGLLGIIKEKKIWATNIRYLNDEREFDYGIDEVLRVLKNGHPDSREDLSETVKSLLKREDPVPVFVVSFSSDGGDELSQWRGYCQEGSGFSIGFEPEKLKELAQKQNFTIEPCVYKKSDQEAKIRAVIPSADEATIGGAASEADEEPFDLDSYLKKTGKERLHLLFDVSSLAPVLKHPKFKEEKEWRLISKDPVICKNRLRFREANSMIVPYIEFDLSMGNESIPIKKIVIGPTPHKELSKVSLEDFLSANEIGNCEVRVTEIPYRYW